MYIQRPNTRGSQTRQSSCRSSAQQNTDRLIRKATDELRRVDISRACIYPAVAPRGCDSK